MLLYSSKRASLALKASLPGGPRSKIVLGPAHVDAVVSPREDWICIGVVIRDHVGEVLGVTAMSKQSRGNFSPRIAVREDLQFALDSPFQFGEVLPCHPRILFLMTLELSLGILTSISFSSIPRS